MFKNVIPFHIFAHNEYIFIQTPKRLTTLNTTQLTLHEILSIVEDLIGNTMFIYLSIISLWFEKRN